VPRPVARAAGETARIVTSSRYRRNTMPARSSARSKAERNTFASTPEIGEPWGTPTGLPGRGEAAGQSGHRACQYHARDPATSRSQRRLATCPRRPARSGPWGIASKKLAMSSLATQGRPPWVGVSRSRSSGSIRLAMPRAWKAGATGR
jgi:hypothetical protein